MSRLGDREIPAPVLNQYLPRASGTRADEVLLSAVESVLETYEAACLG
jgi:hypothetical protein